MRDTGSCIAALEQPDLVTGGPDDAEFAECSIALTHQAVRTILRFLQEM